MSEPAVQNLLLECLLQYFADFDDGNVTEAHGRQPPGIEYSTSLRIWYVLPWSADVISEFCLSYKFMRYFKLIQACDFCHEWLDVVSLELRLAVTVLNVYWCLHEVFPWRSTNLTIQLHIIAFRFFAAHSKHLGYHMCLKMHQTGRLGCSKIIRPAIWIR